MAPWGLQTLFYSPTQLFFPFSNQEQIPFSSHSTPSLEHFFLEQFCFACFCFVLCKCWAALKSASMPFLYMGGTFLSSWRNVPQKFLCCYVNIHSLDYCVVQCKLELNAVFWNIPVHSIIQLSHAYSQLLYSILTFLFYFYFSFVHLQKHCNQNLQNTRSHTSIILYVK